MWPLAGGSKIYWPLARGIFDPPKMIISDPLRRKFWENHIILCNILSISDCCKMVIRGG